MKSEILGLDLGMGACKIYGAAGGIQLPSHVSIADGRIVGNLAGMKAAAPPTKITVDGRGYYVGENAHEWGRPIESVDYERLNGAPEMRAIVYAAIMRYAKKANHLIGEQPLMLWVGMPLEPLTGNKEIVQATINAVRGWLRGDHQFEYADADVADLPIAFHVDQVKITSQPTGALFDYLLSDDGKFIAERRGHLKEEVGIISVGFNTVELLVVQNNAPVQRFTAGTTAGVRRLLDLSNGDGYYSLGELDGKLRSGSLDTKATLPIWGREVTGAIEHTWGRSWRRFARVVVVGGGARILNGQLAFAGKAAVPDDPVLAIARGLYKMAMMKEQRK